MQLDSFELLEEGWECVFHSITTGDEKRHEPVSEFFQEAGRLDMGFFHFWK